MTNATLTITDDAEIITPCDMRDEATEALRGKSETAVEYRVIDGYADGGQALHLLYFPNAQRGAVCDGGNSQWTDCDGIDDLLDRYEHHEERWSN